MSRQFESAMLHVEEEEDEEAYGHFLGLTAVEEEQQNINRHTSHHRGSVQGRITIDRDRHEGHNRLFRDYFAEHPTYPPYLFQRRFRMRRPLFLRIQQAVEAYDSYFVQKMNAAGKLGLSSLQKMTASMWMLAYGVSADLVNDYVRIGESTTTLSLKRVLRGSKRVFQNIGTCISLRLFVRDSHDLRNMQVYPNMRSAFVDIIRNRGFQGLYAGLSPTLVEIIPYAGLQFGTYDPFKRWCMAWHRLRSSNASQADDAISSFQLSLC